MGGSYRSPGNTAPTTEWNVSVDPEAMKVCIAAFGDPAVVERRRAAGLPSLPLALGLDVTERAKMLPDHLDRARPARRLATGPVRATRPRGASPPTRSSATSPTRSASTWSSTRATTASTAPSSTTRWRVAAALDPALVRAEEVAVDVELGGTLTTGETVADWRRTWGRPPTLAVAVEADIAAFFERFVERVGGLAERIGPG